MQNEQVAVEQIDRDEAAFIVRLGAPGVGNGNKVIGDGIKGGLHDDYAIVQSYARHRTRALEAAQAGAGDVGLHEAARDLLRAMLDGQERVGYRLDLWSRLEAALTTPTRIEASQQEAVAQVFEARHCPGIPTDCCDFGVISHVTGKEVCRVWDRDDAELIARLLNTTPPQASHPQEAGEVYVVAVTATKNIPNGLNVVTRLNDWSASSMDEAVGMAVADAQEASPEHQILSITKIVITPPQAAHPQEVVAWMYEHPDMECGGVEYWAERQSGYGEGWTETPLYATPPIQAAESGLLEGMVRDLARDLARYPCETIGLEDMEAGCCGPCRARALLAKAGKPGEAGNA